MSDSSKRAGGFSREKSELFELLLKKKHIDLPQSQTIPRRTGADPCQLSFAQQRLWFLNQLEPDSPFYNVPAILRLTGPLDMGALEQSINEILGRHEVLRTTFATVKESPVQVIAPTLPVRLPVIDLSEWPEAEREAEAVRLTGEETKRPFDLEHGPLLRATLLRLAEEEHVLQMTMHHIVFDGWSAGVLFRELTTLYEAFSSGNPSPLVELPIQYADYAVWQREWLTGEVLDSQLLHWREQLSGAPTVLELPTDRPRPAVQSFRGARKSLVLPKRLGEELQALSRREGVTLFMTLLAAFNALLSRYTSQEDILVGSPIANRNRAEIEGLIGFFVNTLVLRTDLSGDPTFRELLGRVKEVSLGAYAHQEVSFEKLVEELQPERSLSHTPLFQVMFALQNAPRQILELSGLTLSGLAVESGTSPFDLILHMFEGADGLQGRLEYSTDLFDAATIARMMRHFQVLLESIVASPEQHISALRLLSDEERQQLLVEWNNTTAEYPKDKCVHELFEAQVELTPDAVAVVFEGRQLSYGELNRRANQLAHYLRKRGVGPEVRVGIMMERSLEMVIGLLGILKAGGAYVPLDPAYPQERLAFMVADTQAPVLLTQVGLVESLPKSDAEVVCLDTDWKMIAQETAQNPISAARAENLAYVIYTSGSTGKPKGVAMTHGALANLLWWQLQGSTLPVGARTLQFASLSFDVHFQELFSTWCAGGTLVLISEELRREPAGLLRLLREATVERLFLPFVALQQLSEVSDEEAVPGSLREVITAGEQLQVTRQMVNLFSRLPGCRLENQYGPSESHVVTSFTLTGSPSSWAVLPPIGRPIANAEVYILDRYLNPVPVGVPGELYIGGDGLARGYLNRPDLTAERFIPNLFSQKPGARLYKTGDLVRHLVDGNIEFLGRLDGQVKIRGFRIELGEIESVLTEHQGVREAAAVVREDVPGDKRLVAYVVAYEEQRPGAAELPRELRSHLKEKLPEYMVPSAFVMLDELPLTPSGKVDRRALPVPDQARSELEASFVPPRNPIEELVSGIWGEVLKVEQVGIYDNFFDLGGHSLLATQVISRLRRVLQVELPLRSLFEEPTVAGLAARFELARRADEGLQAPPIMPVSRDGKLPLSFAQQRLWFLDQLEPNSSLYNIPQALRLSGSLDAQALRETLTEIAARHESLRTTFTMTDGDPVQVIAPAMSVELPVVDLSELPEGEREAEARRLAKEEAERPFDLTRGPLLRATLLRLGEEEHVLLLNIHHIVSDGWSMGVLFRELGTLYQAFSTGQPSPLPKLPIQYGDYAVWQREWLAGEPLELQLSYWKAQLLGAPPILNLPADHPRPAAQSYRGARQPLRLSKEVTERLKALTRQEGATLFVTLLAAFQTLLMRYTGQEDIVVGSAIAGRVRAEVEGLIGFFVNTLVLRGDLSGNPTFRQLLGRVKEVALGAYAHQDLPFEKLVEELQPERSLSHTPLFQVMFTLQNAPTSSLELSGLTLGGMSFDSQMPVRSDMDFYLWEASGEMVGHFVYNTDLFDASTVARMISHFHILLEGIIAEPDQRLSELPLLTGAERQRLLVEWNDTATLYPRDNTLQQLFEAQVERTPDAVAVVYEDQTLTYRELNERANQVAHYLRRRGVAPEVLVGIMMERSPEMVVGLFGILKAGGAYVPLDPAYPRERLSFMLEDARSPVLLTQSKLVESVPQSEAEVVCIDGEWSEIAGEGTENPSGEATAENVAYVIYTSGSTGKPKGAMILHRGVVNYLSWCTKWYAVAEGGGAPVHSPLGFDLTVTSLFSPLLVGQRVVLVREETGVEAVEALGAALRHEGPFSLVKLTPSHLEVLSQALTTTEDAGRTRALIIGGEALTGESLMFWQEHAPETRLINEYGPTETVVGCCVYELANGQRLAGAVPIGRPIANTHLYVLDAYLNPVPVGVTGELYVGGDGLARGYLNRPELTAERFVANPFGTGPAARLYRTGDWARYLPDGNLEFLGRLDDQVKVRGYRIELGEIEAVLNQHPAVRETAVVVRGEVGGDKRLVAYLVACEGSAALNTSELHRYLRGRLPEYMVPQAFVLLDEMPLTSNGKVDRRALPEPHGGRPAMEAEYVGPRTGVEEEMARIWVEVLDVKQVGVYDNFFELGGHSLLATRVISRIRKNMEVELPLRAIFEEPTVAGLAVAVTERRGGRQDSPIVKIERANRGNVGQLLEKFDQLSDEEVNSLLSDVLAGKEISG